MTETRYIHITNWNVHQHPDTTRNKTGAIPWIKSYTGQLTDEDYVALTWAERGLLESLRLQYASRRGRGITDSTANLSRLFGQRVVRAQVERLNDAGFIQFSASKSQANVQADRPQPASPEVETEREVETEQDQEHLSFPPTEASYPTQNGRMEEEVEITEQDLAYLDTTRP